MMPTTSERASTPEPHRLQCLEGRLRVLARMMGLGRVEGRPRAPDPGDAEGGSPSGNQR